MVRLRSLFDLKRRRITSLYRKRLSRIDYMQTKRQLDHWLLTKNGAYNPCLLLALTTSAFSIISKYITRTCVCAHSKMTWLKQNDIGLDIQIILFIYFYINIIIFMKIIMIGTFSIWTHFTRCHSYMKNVLKCPLSSCTLFKWIDIQRTINDNDDNESVRWVKWNFWLASSVCNRFSLNCLSMIISTESISCSQ